MGPKPKIGWGEPRARQEKEASFFALPVLSIVPPREETTNEVEDEAYGNRHDSDADSCTDIEELVCRVTECEEKEGDATEEKKIGDQDHALVLL